MNMRIPRVVVTCALVPQTVRALVAEAPFDAAPRRTVSPNSSCCTKLWPKEGAGKSFRGTICETRRLAEESADREFWKDPSVRKTASNLPPSKRVQNRYDARNDYLDRLELQRKAQSARLAEEQAKRMNFRKAGQ